MNQDIIYEILKKLHLCPEENGGALLAKKVILSLKHFKDLELRHFEKPIVFGIIKDSIKLSGFDSGDIIYWGDGQNINVSGVTSYEHKYSEKK